MSAMHCILCNVAYTYDNTISLGMDTAAVCVEASGTGILLLYTAPPARRHPWGHTNSLQAHQRIQGATHVSQMGALMGRWTRRLSGLATPGARPMQTLVPVRVRVRAGKVAMMVGVATQIASGPLFQVSFYPNPKHLSISTIAQLDHTLYILYTCTAAAATAGLKSDPQCRPCIPASLSQSVS